MRNTLGRFVAGISGNPGGRPRAAQQARDLIEALTPELVMHLMEIVRDPTETGRARVAAATALLDRRYGRPRRQADCDDGLILPLPADEEPAEPPPPPQPAEPEATAPAAEPVPDGDEPAAEPAAADQPDPEPDPEPARPDEQHDPSPPDITVGGPWRLATSWPAPPPARPIPAARMTLPCSQARP